MSDNELIKVNNSIQESNFYPEFVKMPKDIQEYNKISLNDVALKTSQFLPMIETLKNSLMQSGEKEIIAKVVVKDGQHLAYSKAKETFIGSTLSNETNMVAGQASIKPLTLNPYALAIMVAVSAINKKFDKIEDKQKEILTFLQTKEKANLRGSLVFLQDTFYNYKFNFDNDKYLSSAQIKALDIKQECEKNILFYQDLIEKEISKQNKIHLDGDVTKKINLINSSFQEYQISLYSYAYACLVEATMLGNFSKEYLTSIIDRIKNYASKFDELKNDIYNKIECYSSSSVQNIGLKASSKVTNFLGEKVFSKTKLKDKLINDSEKIDNYVENRIENKMNMFFGSTNECINPFIESIEVMYKVNDNLEIYYDNENLYIK